MAYADQSVAVTFRNEKFSRFRSTVFDVIVKRTSTKVLISSQLAVIDHKSDTIKWSKQSEQSTFLLLWEVWRTHFGVLPFCFVVEYFGLIV